MHLVKKLVAVIVILILVNAGFIWYGQANFEATVKTLSKAFTENNATLRIFKTELPKSIERFLESSGVVNAPYKTLVLQFEGEYRSKPSSRWANMHALALLRPSADMLWGVRLKSNPVVTFNALETYHAGHAYMKMLLFGIVPTGKIEGEEFTRSELARVLAYGVYNPALLKYEKIQYRTIDKSSIEAKIFDGNLSASVTFTFNESGLITEISSQDRVRPVKDGFKPAQWHMKIYSYGVFDGLTLPKKAEESWVIDGNEIIYSKSTLDSVKRL